MKATLQDDDSQQYWSLVRRLERLENADRQTQRVTALIAGQQGIPDVIPDDFEVVYVADAANGVLWALKYNAGSASASKWEVVGGSPLSAEVVTGEAFAGAAWGDATTVGPQLTTPLAGDYDVRFAAHISENAGAGTTLAVGVKFGAAAVSDPNDTSGMSASAATGFTNTPVGRTIRRTIAAATLVKVQYYGGNATGGNFGRRLLQLMPVRVG